MIKHAKKFIYTVDYINGFTYMMGMRGSIGHTRVYCSKLVMPGKRVNYYKYIVDHIGNCIMIHTPKGCFIDITHGKGSNKSFDVPTYKTYAAIKEFNRDLPLTEV